ncbi:fluoride efflux transporter CrcB [Desulfovibrio sp. OttesenSCG-928-O18]|nr:fluoride efflux transporter CrcB [Desulfovibrio sp. OttesenSCG-928-O18]
MLKSIACIAAGATVGATSRWLLGLAFNGLLPLIPMGTLFANLAGGYLIGVMLGIVAFFPQFPGEARLFIITGFLGSLTTFSTFSGEVILLIQERHLLAAGLTVALHLLGSLVMTGLGIATCMFFVRFLR